MKKALFKIALASILAIGCASVVSKTFMGQPVIAAETTDHVASSSNFDHSKTLLQTETEILNDLKINRGMNITNDLSDEFYAALANYENPSNQQLTTNRSQTIEFMNFAVIYRSYMLPYQNGEYSNAEASSYQKDLLSKTYGQIREKNFQVIQQGKLNAQIATMQSTSSLTSSGWSTALANLYASEYAETPNPAYRVFGNDCTNFASQIAQAGGAFFDYSSEIPWYYTNGLAYSRSWTVAQDFANYWIQLKGASVQQYTAQVDLIAGVNPGDFIGYILNDTYVLNHIAYCNRKADGGAYVTQHTPNLNDTSLASRDVSDYSSFVSFHLQ